MRRLFPALLALCLLLAPACADARAGMNQSFGSRGSRTWSAPPATGTAPGGAAGMQRSMTPDGGYAASPGSMGSGYGGSSFGRSGFGTGLAGGLLGFGLGRLLFGHGGGYGYGGGMGGGMGIFGLLLRILITVFVVRFLFRRFLLPRLFGNRRPVAAGGAPGGGIFGSMFAPRTAYAAPGNGMAGGYGAPIGGPAVAIGPSDYQQFESVLKAVQAAWSRADLNAMRNLATPEMISYFANQLADYGSRGQRNQTSDVRLQKGDLSEAWSEDGRSYATVAMRFSMIDTTYDQSGRVVDGSPTEHVTATEYWTFLRASGGHWLLSAIQQGR